MAHLLETLTGSLVTGVFNFSEAYLPTTTSILLNGQNLLHSAGNVWTESDPSTGEVTIDPACLDPGDEIVGFAVPASAAAEECVISGALTGVLQNHALSGVISSATFLTGALQDDRLVGQINDSTIEGTLEDDAIAGLTKDC